MLVYLHGLNSSSRSFKATRLKSELSPFQVLSVDYPAHRPQAAIEHLTRFFSELDTPEPAVIGSSMGGFYGQYLARRFRFSHLFMINPALAPWAFMEQHLGETFTTADGEGYIITTELAASTGRYRVETPCDGTPTTLFIDRGDEVIDCRIAEGLYADCAEIHAWNGGDHAFQHLDEAMDVIRVHLRARAQSTSG